MLCVYPKKEGKRLLKQYQNKLNAVHIVVDIAISLASSALSYIIMYFVFLSDVFVLDRSNIRIMVLVPLIIAALQVLCNRACDLYRSYRSTAFIKEAVNILKSGLIAFVILIFGAIVFSRLYQFQVALMFYFFIYSFLSVLYRFSLRRFLRYMRKKGYNKKYIVLLGINNCTENFIKKIRSSPDLGYEISGYFDNAPHSQLALTYLGNFKKVSRYFSGSLPDEALIMLSGRSQPYMEHLISICERWGVKFSIIPNMFSSFSSRIYISSFDGIPVMSMRRVPLDRTLNKFIKRALDITVSLLMLVLLSPLMLMTALIIKLTSPGAVIFRQERVGLGQRPFTMYKFRSMRVETESDLSGTEKNDPRCTGFGKFIRKFSIDELPQLFNVLKGDMSLVGPRPEIPYYVKQYRKSVPLYMVKHYVKPGISGWAQVNDLRGNDTSIEERIKYDIYYIEHWSVAFDIKILFRTLTKGIFSKNAR